MYPFKGDSENFNSIKSKSEEALIESYILLKAQNFTLTKKFSTSSGCVDPNEEQKMKNYANMVFLFRKTIGILDLESAKKIYANIIYNNPPSHEIPLYFKKKTDCSVDESTLRFDDLHLCHTYQVARLRENMYPKIITETKCSCEKCLQNFDIKDDVKHTCQPTKILSPALIRGHCVKGVYEWYPILEYISVACLCSRTVF